MLNGLIKLKDNNIYHMDIKPNFIFDDKLNE